jgi:hypothetical protein
MKKILVISFLGLACGAITARVYLKSKSVGIVEAKEVKEPHGSFMEAQAKPLEPNKPVILPVVSHDVSREAVEASDAEVLIEDRLLAGLGEDKGIQKVAEVSNVECRGTECSVAVEAKDPEKSGVQMAVLKFVQAHPEFGTNFTVNESKDDPRVTLFTFSRDKK